MKKFIQHNWIIMLILSISINIYAQQPNSAEVHFTMTYTGFDEEVIPQLPSQVKYLVSGNNTKQIVVTKRSVMRVIANADSMFMANLNDIDNNKVGLIYYADDLKVSAEAFVITVKPSKETRNILGYACKKYEIDILNKETKELMKEVVFATTQLGGNNINFVLYKDVKGFILYSKKMVGNETTIMQATKVIKRPIPPTDFLIPSAYTLTTFKEQLLQDK